jgi:hypothetical protein
VNPTWWRQRRARKQRKYLQWLCSFHRSGSRGQPFGSPKPRPSSLWSAWAMREQNFSHLSWITGTQQRWRTSLPVHHRWPLHKRWGLSCWTDYPLERAASSPTPHARDGQFLRWLRSLARTCRTTFCAASGPAGYLPTYKPLSPASMRFSWSPQTALPRPPPDRRSLALMNSVARWLVSALAESAPLQEPSLQLQRPSIQASEPETATTDRPPDMTLQQPPAGATDASETRRKIVPSRATAASRVTSLTYVSVGTRPHNNHRLPLQQSSKQRFLI